MSLEQQTEVQEGWLSLLERFSDPEQFKALPDYVRQLYRGGALFALGIVETWHDGAEALSRAHELESLGLRIYDRAANQIRMLYHAGRGELERAEHYRKRMELHAIQTGSAWQVEVTVPLTLAVVYSALGDIVGLKRAGEQVEQLAARLQVGSLERTARLSRAGQLLLRGSTQEAIAIYESVLGGHPPRAFVGWARAVGYHAEAYNRLGRHEEALRMCEQAMTHVRPQDRRFVRVFLMLEIQLALAEAGLGRTKDASERLERLREEHAAGGNPLTLGSLHEACARVALIARHAPAFERHAAEVDRWYRPTGVPSLIARVERLSQQGEDVLSVPRQTSLSAVTACTHSTAYSALSQCADDRARGLRALELALADSGAAQGHLFLLAAGGELRLAASTGGEPPAELRRQASDLARSFAEEAGATRVETRVVTQVGDTRALEHEGEFRCHLLWIPLNGEPKLVGVVAIRKHGEVRAMDFHFLQALAEGLQAGSADARA